MSVLSHKNWEKGHVTGTERKRRLMGDEVRGEKDEGQEVDAV